MIKARKEVILSCGVVNTPQILMLSGIGPKEQLKSFGIKVIADLPVGQNLQDQITAPVLFSLDGKSQINTAEQLRSMTIQYLFDREGPLSHNGLGHLVGYLDTTERRSMIPDLEIFHLYFPPNDTFGIPLYFKAFNYGEEYQRFVKEINSRQEVVSFYPAVLRPKSIGKITLQSKNPYDPPLIYPDTTQRN